MSLIDNTIKTERLFLRPLTDSDVAAIHEYASDPSVCEFLDWGPNSLADTEDFLKRTIAENHLVPRKIYDWAIVLPDTSKLVGGISLRLVEGALFQAYLGYVLNKQYWGQGYATEASCGVIQFGFMDVKIARISATCDARNLGSKRVLEKCGMKFKRRLNQDQFVGNNWRDTLEYCLLASEWWVRNPIPPLHK